MKEVTLQNKVIKLARERGYWVYHTPDSRRVTSKGFPDLVLLHPGTQRLIFAELKSDKGRATPEQKEWLAALPNSYLWRPEDLPTIEEIL